MFITSFEEQNITYRSCSNLRIHLYGTRIDGKLDQLGEAEIQNTPLGKAEVYFGYSENKVVLPSIDDFEYEFTEESLRNQISEYLEIEGESFEVEDVVDSFLNLTAYFVGN